MSGPEGEAERAERAAMERFGCVAPWKVVDGHGRSRKATAGSGASRHARSTRDVAVSSIASPPPSLRLMRYRLVAMKSVTTVALESSTALVTSAMTSVTKSK